MSAAGPPRVSSEAVGSGPGSRGSAERLGTVRRRSRERWDGRPRPTRTAPPAPTWCARSATSRPGWADCPSTPTRSAAVSNVFRVANAVRLHMERQVLGADGISWTGFVVLWVLWVWGEQEARHLAAECGVSKATLTGVVGTLEGRGLVARRRHADDGRLVIVKLTPAGRRMIRRLFPRFNEHEALVVSRLGTDEQDQLAHLLREVLACGRSRGHRTHGLTAAGPRAGVGARSDPHRTRLPFRPSTQGGETPHDPGHPELHQRRARRRRRRPHHGGRQPVHRRAVRRGRAVGSGRHRQRHEGRGLGLRDLARHHAQRAVACVAPVPTRSRPGPRN